MAGKKRKTGRTPPARYPKGSRWGGRFIPKAEQAAVLEAARETRNAHRKQLKRRPLTPRQLAKRLRGEEVGRAIEKRQHAAEQLHGTRVWTYETAAPYLEGGDGELPPPSRAWGNQIAQTRHWRFEGIECESLVRELIRLLGKEVPQPLIMLSVSTELPNGEPGHGTGTPWTTPLDALGKFRGWQYKKSAQLILDEVQEGATLYFDVLAKTEQAPPIRQGDWLQQAVTHEARAIRRKGKKNGKEDGKSNRGRVAAAVGRNGAKHHAKKARKAKEVPGRKKNTPSKAGRSKRR